MSTVWIMKFNSDHKNDKRIDNSRSKTKLHSRDCIPSKIGSNYATCTVAFCENDRYQFKQFEKRPRESTA